MFMAHRGVAARTLLQQETDRAEYELRYLVVKRRCTGGITGYGEDTISRQVEGFYG